MTATNLFNATQADAVEAAARSLVQVTREGTRQLVTLPLFYPSGAAATVEVKYVGPQFHINDCGLAYHEAEMLGGEYLFQRNAPKVAQKHGVQAGRQTLHWMAQSDQLAGGIADVAGASTELARTIVERLAKRSETDIEDHLYPKLKKIFGKQNVSERVELSGASAHKWTVSALVQLGGPTLAFQAVTNHHSSVYTSGIMLHDLFLLERKVVPIAVVRNKEEMGDYLRILAQSANVIQEDVAEAELRRLAA
ncbi:hypothetical protein [Acidisoma silvae]|uniref:Uncharacterized protein n=1 Tax=Acidisoma silvae TaxID=2802396 RepID=A0A963YRW2_9PROT|nr:hypothetical protein [Acidisoma silvae]MCB8875751.1 hypothetical protein [Acidisoma silvae]